MTHPNAKTKFNCTFKINMKKLIFIFLFLSAFSATSFAQIAFVDTKAILNKMPGFQDAQKQLQQQGTQWQKEIDDKQAVLDKMQKDYESDEPLLTNELKNQRQIELLNLEKEVRDLQRRRFGYEGDMFKMRQELVKPIEDSINAAVQKVALARNLSIVLDKSAGVSVMFSDAKLDISDEVMKMLGLN
jgi:outer membrane protein